MEETCLLVDCAVEQQRAILQSARAAVGFASSPWHPMGPPQQRPEGEADVRAFVAQVYAGCDTSVDLGEILA
eukprot:11195860-Lingulodinium_polyedra.AAC.1